jgi:hypothetical protein
MSTTEISVPAIGATMPDGSLYAGVSPDTGRPMYTTPKDAKGGFLGIRRGNFNLKCAFAAASKLKAHGHKDWRMPTKAELNVLFENRNRIGNFDTTGLYSAGWYWASSRNGNYLAWVQRFSDGAWNGLYNLGQSSLRCVRG